MHAVVSMVCRVGTEIEVKKVGSDGSLTMARARVATKRRTKKGGEWVDADTWFSVVAFGREAERMEQKAVKGDLCFVSGEVYSSDWTDREGQVRTTLEVKVDRFAVVSKPKRQEPRNDDHRGGSQGYSQAGGYSQPDEDIPF